MFDVLVLSGAHLQLKPRWISTSLATHALAGALAIMATQAALQSAVDRCPRDTRTAVRTQGSAAAAAEAKPDPPTPAVVVAEPPPKGFQTVAALQDIPDLIPPVDLTQRALDPRDFTGRGEEGGLAAGVVGGTGKADVWSGTPASDAIYEATMNDERFAPAIVVFQPAPRYPKHLETLGLEGRVVVEFVIDTAGQVEPASLRVLESTHQAFDQAAQTAMLESVFKPARLSGHPVRQLTRQAVRFVSMRQP